MTFISLLLVCGLIAFSVYQGVQIYRILKERKKAKSNLKENDENGRNSGCEFNYWNSS
jgi:hypothetical protein